MLNCKISHRFGKRNILDNIDFSLENGKHLLILGDSGTGKTTLFSILTGIQKPTEGRVCYEGQDIFTLKSSKIDNFRGSNIGIIFQQLHLIDIVSIKEYIELRGSLAQQKNDDIDQIICELGLKDKLNHKIKDLSHGEKQRVSIAVALVNQPKWIFADEPTSALDDNNTQAIIKILKFYASKSNASLIIATHDKRLKDSFADNSVLELSANRG